MKSQCPAPPVAISFGITGPADYPHGVIGDVANLSGFRGGVALGPMLEDKFKIPVFINNDADLFVYGEAIAGLLPHVNQLLEAAGNPKRYHNLFGLTLGTGLGGGIVRNGELFLGDNSLAGEIWLMRNKLETKMNVEEGACIRAVRRVFAQQAGISIHDDPIPKASSKLPGRSLTYRGAALEAYRRLGEVAGDTLANALTLVDGLAVIGGGVSKGWRLFMPALMAELNGNFTAPTGENCPRLVQKAYNLEEPAQLAHFIKGEIKRGGRPRFEPQSSIRLLRAFGRGHVPLGHERSRCHRCLCVCLA